MNFSEPHPRKTVAFVQKIIEALDAGSKETKLSVEKMAQSYGITDKTLVKELTELAIVVVARKLALAPGTTKERFDKIVALYNSQVNLSHRTSQSILLQQYSTPAPIGFLLGLFCKINLFTRAHVGFEPSAGNGLLTIAAKPEYFVVNEIDRVRHENLKIQDFADVFRVDGSKPFSQTIDKAFDRLFDAVITNPPFGRLDKPVYYDTYAISDLDNLMALRALDCLKDTGRSAFIIGGHTKWDDKGRIQAGRNRVFFNYLYSRYNVVDVIQINGRALYSRQGTSVNVRIVLIHGRKPEPMGVAPIYNPSRDTVVSSFDALYKRITEDMEQPYPIAHVESYMSYLGLKDRYTDEVLLLNKDEGQYAAFGRNAQYLSNISGVIVETVLVDDKEIAVSYLDDSMLDEMLDLAIARGLALVLDDAIEASEEQLRIWEEEADDLKLFMHHGDDLGMVYTPASESCMVLDTQVPDSMGFETHSSLERIKAEVGGDIDNFVRDRLKYPSKQALCKALSAEQTDAVAMAIYNIEARGQGMIIGDQTGIGKGRVAAAIIRYGIKRGLKPIFITEKANLFSDIYRDLVAIGSSDLVPFIVNTRESKTDIKDEDGNIVYQALAPTEQASIIKSKKIPQDCDFVVATYSQFNSFEKKPEKPDFLRTIAKGNILIMDEAHNSSGASNTGIFMQDVVASAIGVAFLSATFAKRPDNMPIYAIKTAISDCNMTKGDLVTAIIKGGVALQEVLSSQLVAEGQMLRRERSFEGIEVNYITLEDKAQEHFAIADNITTILRDIIAFQDKFINQRVEELDRDIAYSGKESSIREGTQKAGVDNLPYFSKIFQVIHQMLFSIKADAVSDRAIERLKEGKKPVIAFASTMGSFIEQMETEGGTTVAEGDVINADFSEVLRRGLDGVLRYTITDADGEKKYYSFDVASLSEEAQAEYYRIYNTITVSAITTGITISPIDVIVQKLTKAGYRVAEVTGRKFELQLDLQSGQGLVKTRKKINTNDAFRKFNNNEVDVLLINQSGSTGASAHAIVTAKVPASEVKQRVMIVLQAELDINTEVQKRGRINRTGQILKPIYDYVNSAIPAEKRLMMMLQKKLKSLDANTTSNQKQSTKILDVPDFLNKYGDKVVVEYLSDNPEINKLLGYPLSSAKAGNTTDSEGAVEDGAHKVSGRVAVLSTKMQTEFYNEMNERYNDYVEYLRQTGGYDLEVENMNLEAELLSRQVVKMGKGGDSAFGHDSYLEKVMANILKKPFTSVELANILKEASGGKSPLQAQEQLLEDLSQSIDAIIQKEKEEVQAEFAQKMGELKTHPKLLKLWEKEGEEAYSDAVAHLEQRYSQSLKDGFNFIERKYKDRMGYLERLFKYFYTGRKLLYPQRAFGEEQQYILAVFIGFQIDKRKKSPFVPSVIKLRFAIANSSKYLAIPASFSQDINAIMGASNDVEQVSDAGLMAEWEAYINKNSTDRGIRYFVTGNLLQAFSDYKGRLVSYTTKDGGVQKGILLPEYFEPDDKTESSVSVPIIKAASLIKSLVMNKAINTSGGLSIFRTSEGFKLVVPASRIGGGDIYLDSDLLPLVEKEMFEKVSDKMTAIVSEAQIDKVIQVLQANHSLSLEVFRYQLKELDSQGLKDSTRKPIELPAPEAKTNIRILELEAEAVLLELALMAA